MKPSPELLTVVRFEVEAVPPTINAMMRKHWTWRRNQKALWMELIRYGLTSANLGLLHEWRWAGNRVRIEVEVHHNREFDPDNLASVGKIPLDCLKTLGFITDDKSKHIEFSASQVKARKPLTVICISPIVGTL